MILLTGGAGYIGSHMAVALAEQGIPYILYDNFVNSHSGVLHRLKLLGNGVNPLIMGGDIRDPWALDAVFSRYPIDSVIHFAGLKSVAESMINPGLYYENNLAGSITLVRAMQRAGVKRLVFSSSATVYGEPVESPVSEEASVNPANPYGWSKLLVENVLRDIARTDPTWKVACLRYFNPVGAHPSGLIGENPQGTPNNLMPFISQVASGYRPYLNIFGNDYPTPDGTGVRDYIHVQDLVEGHLSALKFLQEESNENCITINLGAGKGISVFEMVHAFMEFTGRDIPYIIQPRRVGDVPQYYADSTLAYKILEWKTTRDIRAMCEDTWRWQNNNPLGYES